ncbi:MAG: alpha/beta fold hydrolase [Vicinamibacterales bacterium]
MPEIHALATADGLRLSARRTGAGPVRVVLPNGAYYVEDLAPLWTSRPAVAYDLRNRGASATVTDPARLDRGVLADVDDLEHVREHLEVDAMALVAHSYVAEVALHYAITHPARVTRLVLLGPSGYGVGHGTPPRPDAAAGAVFQRLGALQATAPADPEARCRAFWEVLAPLYVVDPVHAPRVAAWGRCDSANERAFPAYWTAHVEPSLVRLAPTAGDLARAGCPVLVVHGDHDRSTPYAAGRAWAARLPDARLLTVPGAAHAPWLEAPDLVLPALDQFLDGAWPDAAAVVRDDA